MASIQPRTFIYVLYISKSPQCFLCMECRAMAINLSSHCLLLHYQCRHITDGHHKSYNFMRVNVICTWYTIKWLSFARVFDSFYWILNMIRNLHNRHFAALNHNSASRYYFNHLEEFLGICCIESFVEEQIPNHIQNK